MKRFTIVFFVLLFSTLAFAQDTYEEIKLKLDSLVSDDYFNTCTIAIDAFNLTDNKHIYSKNERLLLRPASNQKVLTTATGLVFLGEDYKFSTKLFFTGSVKDSVCLGDVYFVGGFDPDFTSADLSFMVKKLKEQGINKVNGKIYGDVTAMDSLFWGSGWMWDDDPSSDFPYFSPLTINDACVKLVYSPSEIGEKPIIEGIPQSGFYSIENNAVVSEGKSKDFNIIRDWLPRSNRFVITGSLSADEIQDTVKLNVFDVNNYFLTLANEEMNRQGIKTSGQFSLQEVPKDANFVYSFDRSFGEVIVNLNKTSDNLSAEMTLRALGYKYFDKPSSAKNGVKMIDSLIVLAGKNPNDYRLEDGSGVSYYNLISAELLNSVVKYIYNKDQKLYNILYNSFPIGGIDGTLKSRMKNAPTFNNVHAKTGTLSGVSSLTGYLTAQNGDIISFSVLTQNFVGSARIVRNYQDKVCEILYNLK